MAGRRQRVSRGCTSRDLTYVWFSPLGARIHAAAQKIAVTRSPMKGAQLGLLVAVSSVLVAHTYPFAILFECV